MAERKGEIRTQVRTDTPQGLVGFEFGKGTGDNWHFLDSKVFLLGDLPEDMQRQMALYGVRKALMDRTSDWSDRMQREDNPRLKMDAMQDLWDRRFMQGMWKEPSKASGGGGIPLIVQAVAEYKGVGTAQAQKAWKAQSEDQRERIKAQPAIQEIVERLQKEEAEGPLDLTELGGDA